MVMGNRFSSDVFSTKKNTEKANSSFGMLRLYSVRSAGSLVSNLKYITGANKSSDNDHQCAQQAIDLLAAAPSLAFFHRYEL